MQKRPVTTPGSKQKNRLGLPFRPCLERLEERWNPAQIGFPLGLDLPSHSLAIISPEIEAQVPLEELAGSQVLVLEPGMDAVAQITRRLSTGDGPFETVRFLSHGRDGGIHLAGQWLDGGTLARRPEAIAAWGEYLAPGADILLYGCSVANSQKGEHFVESLALLTGADVAASTNPTGAAGDLILEFGHGSIEAKPAGGTVTWQQSGLTLEETEYLIQGVAGSHQFSSPFGISSCQLIQGVLPLGLAADQTGLVSGTAGVNSPGTYRLVYRLTPVGGAAYDQPLTLVVLPDRFRDPNPSVGNGFGTKIVPLASGNIAITAPLDDSAAQDTGAVYLFNGSTGALISTLRGSTANDKVGSGGITALPSGNFVVTSPQWDNGATVDCGASTWVNGTKGLLGTVSKANSLIGSTLDDFSTSSTIVLTNGNFVVVNPRWDNGPNRDSGAVTWGNGTTGVSGLISSQNSLVGSTAQDRIGFQSIQGKNHVLPLSNGNYVVGSTGWNNGAVEDAGAVTWGDGTIGTRGVVSVANSLVGSSASDRVGMSITPLTNGNYVVGNSGWNNGAAKGAGAATWGNGTTGIKGAVSANNSLVGSTTGDNVGYGIVPLTNGNYVVASDSWDNGNTINAGAATWGNGTTGIKGVVSINNSLVGGTAEDKVGYTVTPLTNGNYVVNIPDWDNGAAKNAGAATWGNGTTGIKGAVSAANSLVGTSANDRVGSDTTALTNGNYVVSSPGKANGATPGAGAATWGNGTTGIKGAVSAANSLVGTSINDLAGSAIKPLPNGHYVVVSPFWDNGATANAGAATWGNGTTGIKGAVSAANSLVGSTAEDLIGSRFLALSNGNYVVGSPNWNNGAILDAGAVTWGNGTTGTKGAVSTANSLVGSTASDQVGESLDALTNGNYAVVSQHWDNGLVQNAGAVTWGNGTTGTKGAVSTANSLIGNHSSDFSNSEILPLTTGDYLVLLHFWDFENPAPSSPLGAVSWGPGTAPLVGETGTNNTLLFPDSTNPATDSVNRMFFTPKTVSSTTVLVSGGFASGFNQAPVLRSTNTATFTQGLPGRFLVGASANPAPTYSLASGSLPAGVSLDPTTGVLSGTPAAGTGGRHSFTLRAANGVGAAHTQAFTLLVNEAPTITSANNASFSQGQAGTFQIVAKGYPAPTFSVLAGSLPEGINLSADGTLSGNPAEASIGQHAVTFRASNGIGFPATQAFTLTVKQSQGMPGVYAVAAMGGGGGFSALAIYRNGTRDKVREVIPFPGFRGEFYVDSGDINNDLIEDIIVGSGNGSQNGHVVVFDGARLLNPGPGAQVEWDYSQGGSVLASLYAFIGYRSGVAVRLADITDDGFDDIVLAPGTGAGTVTHSHLRVWDGKLSMQQFSQKAAFQDYRYDQWELASFWAFGSSASPGGGLAVSVVRQAGADQIIASQLFGGGSKVFRYDGQKVLALVTDLGGASNLFPNGNTVVGFDLNGTRFYASAGTAAGSPDSVFVRQANGAVLYTIDQIFGNTRGGLRIGLGNMDQDATEELMVTRPTTSTTRLYNLSAQDFVWAADLLPGGVSAWV